jgi:hypothetical protein
VTETVLTANPGSALVAARARARTVIDRLVDEVPAFHSGGSKTWNAMPATLEVIQQRVGPGDVTVETGAGASTVVFAAMGALHTAISPFGDEHRRIADYGREVDIDMSNVSFAEGRSCDILPTLDAPKLDAAFIDGMHSFPHPIVDFHFIEERMRLGGLLLLDDLPIPAVGVLAQFLDGSPTWQRLDIVDGRAGVYQKRAEADREDNWRRQPFNRRYPDFSVLGLPDRIRFGVPGRLPVIKEKLVARVPALSGLRSRLRSGHRAPAGT